MKKNIFSVPQARRIFSLGLPVFIAQLSQTGLNFADTVMAGRYSADALAAVAIAGGIWIPVLLLAIGCLQALPGMCSQLVGQRRHDQAAHVMRQGLFLAVFSSLLEVAVLLPTSFAFELFGLTPDMADLAGAYLRALLPGLPFILSFIAMRSYLEGYGQTRPAMVISMLTLLLNIPLNYAFIYGRIGCPELGAVGCGVATSACNVFMSLCMAGYILRARHLRQYAPLGPSSFLRRPIIDGRRQREILKIGFPNATSLFLECFLYAATALLLAPLGSSVVAGHQVTMSYATIVFMVPLALGVTSTMVVAKHLGARRLTHARSATSTALVLGVVSALLIMLVTVLFREGIVAIYNDDVQVTALASTLMLYCAAYQIADIIQCVSSGILRGYNDTLVISIVGTIAYGVIGLPAGYLLGMTDVIVPALGAPGFWLGYLVALLFSSTCFLARIVHLHRLSPERIDAMITH